MNWDIIKNGLANSMSYKDYQELFQQKVDDQATTGPNQTEDLINYTKLNFHRSKRVDKKATIGANTVDKLQQITSPQTWILITETWCGDAAQSVPYFNAMAQHNDNINLRIVLRDDNLVLMDQFLTKGGRSIPKLIIVDEAKKEVVADWGPRPETAQNIYLDYKVNPNGRVYNDIAIELQKWYTKDKGEALQSEVMALL